MSFKKGDVCVIVRGQHWSSPEPPLVARIGIECVVNGPNPDLDFGPCYDVTCVDGHKFKKIMEGSLRLKKPPSKSDPVTDFVPCDGEFLEDLKRQMGKVKA